MAIIVWIEITCEECTEGSGLRYRDLDTAKSLRAEFKSRGWVYKKVDVDGTFIDLCPTCKEMSKYE
jgi:hypothetical protein